MFSLDYRRAQYVTAKWLVTRATPLLLQRKLGS